MDWWDRSTFESTIGTMQAKVSNAMICDMSGNDVWNELKSIVVDFEFCSFMTLNFVFQSKWNDLQCLEMIFEMNWNLLLLTFMQSIAVDLHAIKTFMREDRDYVVVYNWHSAFQKCWAG